MSDDLLKKAAMVPKKKKESRPDNRVEQFIKEFDIRPSETEMVDVIFIYNKYIKNMKAGGRMSITWFGQALTKIFKKKDVTLGLKMAAHIIL
jgi:hypothetical protein